MIKRVLTTSFYSIVSRFFITATNLFVVFYVSKYLGKMELGNYGIVFFFFILFSVLSSFSLSLFFGKEIAKYERGSREESEILNELILVTIIGILITLILPVIIFLFYKKISFSLIMLSAVAGYFLGIERNLGGILLGRERMPLEAITNFFSFSVIFSSMFFSTEYFNSINKIFFLKIFVLIAVVLLKLWFIRDHFKGLRINLKFRFFKEGKFYWFGGMSNVVLREVDILILSFFIDRSLLGAYFLALRIYFSFGVLSEVITYGLTPFISRTYSGKERRGFKEFNRGVMVIISTMALLSALILFFSREYIISLFAGNLVETSGKYLFYFSFLLFFRFFSFFTGMILTSTEFQKIKFYIISSSSLIMIVSDVMLAPIFQIKGIIFSRSLVEIGIFFAYAYFVRKIFKEYRSV